MLSHAEDISLNGCGQSSCRLWWRVGILLAAIVGALLVTFLVFPPVTRLDAQCRWFSIALCAIPSLAALLLVGLVKSPNLAPTAILGGMMIRTGIPLIGGLLLVTNLPELKEAGLMNWVLGFYLGFLALETPLAATLVSARNTRTKAA